ncbi:MAG TPA: MlaD family protein [Chthonomonadaceae bacterium]|nr:MlaD family protein [Chthonomonadaceae bacterium]
MEAKSAVRVGIVVLAALALGIGLLLYLNHTTLNTYTIRVNFTDTEGLQAQSVVRMRGVPIGEVAKVELDPATLKPYALVSIKKTIRIPNNYKFSVASGLLITTAQLQVSPPSEPDTEVHPPYPDDNTAVVTAESPAGTLASLSPELSELLKNLNKSVKELDTKELSRKLDKAYNKVDGVLDQTKILMETATKTATAANAVIADPKLKQTLVLTLENLKDTSSNAKLMTAELRSDLDDLVASNKDNITNFGKKLNDLLSHVDSTLVDADAVVQKLTEQVSDPRFQQSLQETADLARTTLSRFNQIASDLHELTGDPELRNDLRQTVANLRSATDQGQEAIQKVNALLGNLTGTAGKVKAPRLPKVELVSNISEQLSPSRLRLDVDGRFHFGKSDLVDIGLYDLGQNTRLNLQAGNQLTDSLLVRYGLYASKIGVGTEYQVTPEFGLRGDLWDTSRPRLDVKGLLRVNKSASIWFGSDSLFDHPIPIIGVQINH